MVSSQEGRESPSRPVRMLYRNEGTNDWTVSYIEKSAIAACFNVDVGVSKRKLSPVATGLRQTAPSVFTVDLTS